MFGHQQKEFGGGRTQLASVCGDPSCFSQEREPGWNEELELPLQPCDFAPRGPSVLGASGSSRAHLRPLLAERPGQPKFLWIL